MDFQTSKIPIKLSNVTTNKPDMIVNKYSRIQAVDPADITFKQNHKMVANAIVTLSEMEMLAPGQIVSTKAEVFEISETKPYYLKDQVVSKQDAVNQ